MADGSFSGTYHMVAKQIIAVLFDLELVIFEFYYCSGEKYLNLAI